MVAHHPRRVLRPRRGVTCPRSENLPGRRLSGSGYRRVCGTSARRHVTVWGLLIRRPSHFETENDPLNSPRSNPVTLGRGSETSTDIIFSTSTAEKSGRLPILRSPRAQRPFIFFGRWAVAGFPAFTEPRLLREYSFAIPRFPGSEKRSAQS